jgi:hypothetical protein
MDKKSTRFGMSACGGLTGRRDGTSVEQNEHSIISAKAVLTVLDMMRISCIGHRTLLLLLLSLFRAGRVCKRRRHVIRIIGRWLDGDVVRVLVGFAGFLFRVVFDVCGDRCRAGGC